MAKTICQQKGTEFSEKPPEAAQQGKESGGVFCFWCFLVKEGVKKTYSGIKRLRGNKAK